MFQRLKEHHVAEEFGPSGEIRVCLQSMDQRTKTFNFFFDIQNQPKVIKGTGVSMTHLNEQKEKISKIQNLLDVISRNIYIKNEIDKELTDISIDNQVTQQWLSIIKFVLVAAMCAGQVYFVTLFFTTGQKKRAQGSNVAPRQFTGI